MALPTLAPPSHIVTLNALYHTFKILLYRPMLSRRSRADDEDDIERGQAYLVECVTGATTILAIFDLFCRSFGIGQCDLSLSYSVYIAASIFLLQVQSNVEDAQAVRRLEYCVRTLTQIKRVNPGECRCLERRRDTFTDPLAVISSALQLIMKEVASLGIDSEILGMAKPSPTPPMSTYGIPSATAVSVPTSPGPYDFNAARSPQDMHHLPLAEAPGPEAFAFDPQVFHAMSCLEPLSVRMGAISHE